VAGWGLNPILDAVLVRGDAHPQGIGLDKRQTRAFESFAAEPGNWLLRMATLLTSDLHAAEEVYSIESLTPEWWYFTK
jgi:hypothetical protein